MRPNANNAPTDSSQTAIRATVSGNISAYFPPPIITVGRRNAAMLPASMPETAIQEDGQLIARKGEIRQSGQRLVATPSLDTCRP
jgi:hypothetical protein